MPLSLAKTPAQLFSKQLAHLKYIQLIENDLKQIAGGTQSGGPGSRQSPSPPRIAKLESKIRFLHQTYVVHLVASWEAFIEELVRFGFRRIVAQDGPLREPVELPLNTIIKRFHTPGRDEIDRLFKETIGIEKISKCWNCKSLSMEDATKTLKFVLKTRHAIAHTSRTSSALSIEDNFKSMEILYEMACQMEKAVTEHVKAHGHNGSN